MKRAIDQLGRLVIPAEYRKEIGIKINDVVNIELRGNEIIITNPKNNILNAEGKNKNALNWIKQYKNQWDNNDEVLKDLNELEKILS